jgi:hypothetical protein
MNNEEMLLTLLENGMFDALNDREFEAILAHYGVKGQKWGVIRKGRQAAKAKAKQNEVKKAAAKKLSDAELKKAVARMELERNYNRLMKERADAERSSLKRGTDWVAGVMGKAGQNAIRSYIDKETTRATKRILERFKKGYAPGGGS